MTSGKTLLCSNLKKERFHNFLLLKYVVFVCLQAGSEELQKDIIANMVWTPENLDKNALHRINMYKDTMLRPLEVS